jgi:hypothetical protein
VNSLTYDCVTTLQSILTPWPSPNRLAIILPKEPIKEVDGYPHPVSNYMVETIAFPNKYQQDTHQMGVLGQFITLLK